MMRKTFNIDWDNLEEVRHFYNQAKSRFFELKHVTLGTPSRKERERRVLQACEEIWKADLSDIYGGGYDTSHIYYVYAHLDSSKRVQPGARGRTTFAALLGMNFWPFYVGKGTGGRCDVLQRNETHRKVRQRLVRLGLEPSVVRVADGLTESEALQCEAKLIDIFGLVTNGGMLSNLDEGVCPDVRRQRYIDAYQTLTRINIPLTSTHVDGVAVPDKTRVVPASSTISRTASTCC
jgi:hypothetical protein